MPSASAKLEKQGSTESNDPIKHVLTMVEKKVRNLEKRKGKLDHYREEYNNGKELQEEQMNAMKKYDQVVEILDFSKDMQKSIQVIIQECAKQQKRVAKREQMERQQQELQRIREIIQLQDLLDNMGTDDVRQDFLAGSQGAVKLSQEDLDRLDELYKLVSPDRHGPEFEMQLMAAAEHLTNLLDGKNKELLNGAATYKGLKELLTKINNSGYFSHGSKEEEVVAEEEVILPEGKEVAPEEFTDVQQETQLENAVPFYAGSGEPVATSFVGQPPLPEVLHVQGNFNFLQDSQVDVESARTNMTPYPPAAGVLAPTAAHMDPAVVAAQPMAGFLAAPQEDFDPVGPIPTQTFTNQNYAMMGMAPGSYVAPQPMGMPIAAAPPTGAVVPPQQEEDTFLNVQEYQGTTVGSNSTANPQYQSSDDNEEGAEGSFTQMGPKGGFRGGRGNRGGPRQSNGYSRGGRGFSNGRGGGYQNSSNNYYRDRDNYNSGGQRRGGGGSQNPSATPRGGPNRGGPRGRGGNFRPQQQ